MDLEAPDGQHTCQTTGCEITFELDLKRYKCDDSNRLAISASPLINYAAAGLETNTTWVGRSQPTAVSVPCLSLRRDLTSSLFTCLRHSPVLCPGGSPQSLDHLVLTTSLSDDSRFCLNSACEQKVSMQI